MRGLLCVALILTSCQLFLASLDETGNCADLLDNDNNGLADCDDPVCADELSCDTNVCVISVDLNLNQQSCVGLSTPDAVSFPLAGVVQGTTIISLPSTEGLLVGDTILLIDLQGTAIDTASVGLFETLTISAVSPTDITLATPVLNGYPATDRIMLQRVPRYTSVLINAGATLTADPWNGTQGGVLALIAGDVIVDGSIDMSGRGYRGGQRPTDAFQRGFQGESIDGVFGAQNRNAPFGGGGAGSAQGECGQDNGTAGAGGGHGTAGTSSTVINCAIGGDPYAVPDLSRLFLGSGGGSGGNDNTLTDNPLGGEGGFGGGVILIQAAALTVNGQLSSNGSAGQGDALAGCFGGSTIDCFDFSGPGGGGAGGSLLLNAAVSGANIFATGGAGGLGGSSNAGNGGDGAILIP